MKPQSLVLSLCLFATGLITGKFVFQNPASSPDPQVTLSQRSQRTKKSDRTPTGHLADRIAQAQSLLGADARENEFLPILQELVFVDPAQAAALLSEISDTEVRLKLGKEMIRSWIISDSDAALDWLQGQPGSPLRTSLSLAAFERSLFFDPRVAKTVYERMSSLHNDANMEKLTKFWARSDFAGAKEYATGKGDFPFKTSALIGILEEWGRRSPKEAVSYLEGLPKFHKGMVGQNCWGLLKAWASKDPAAAFEYATTFDRGPAITAATHKVFETWVKDDPQAAIAAMEEISDRVYSDSRLATAWASEDLDAAKNWLLTGERRNRQEAMNELILDVSKTNFRKASQLLNEFSEWSRNHEADPSDSLVQAGKTLATSWLRNDRDEAMAWIKSLAHNEIKEEIIHTAVREIDIALPEVAQSLAATLPPGEARARTVSDLVQQLRQHGKLAEAFNASQIILDEQARLRTTEDIIRRMKASDPETALKFLDGANIPSAERERIRVLIE